jgi:hypothetical protein
LLAGFTAVLLTAFAVALRCCALTVAALTGLFGATAETAAVAGTPAALTAPAAARLARVAAVLGACWALTKVLGATQRLVLLLLLLLLSQGLGPGK